VKQTNILLLIFLLSVSTFIPVKANDDSSLHIHDPWIREAPSNAKILAAYLIIENHTDKSVTITAVSSPMFNKIEIHRSSTLGGMMKMNAIQSLTIKPNEKLILKSGNIHLMLFKPHKALKHGDIIEIIFQLKNGEKITAKTIVKKVIGSMKPHHTMSTDSHPQHNH